MMKFSPQPIVAFLVVVLLVAKYAHALAPELYWKSKLPTTPIPKSITDILHPSGGSTTVHGGIRRRPADHSYDYCYNPPPTKLRHNPDPPVFFLEKDLKAGHKVNFLFTQTSNQASFVPREVAESAGAEVMKDITIQGCGMKGEDKRYATSLESMVDYITLKLGENVEALCTEVMTKKERKKQEYTIKNGVKKVGEAKVVACHKLNYMFAVFYCHKQENTVAYTVPLEGADGSRVNAASVCHRDTSAWNPKHMAFQVLKVKPGAATVCHFIPQDDVVWILKQN